MLTVLKPHFFMPNSDITSHSYVIWRVIAGNLKKWTLKTTTIITGKFGSTKVFHKEFIERPWFSRNLEDFSFRQTSRKVQSKIIHGIFPCTLSNIRSEHNRTICRIGGHLMTILIRIFGRIWQNVSHLVSSYSPIFRNHKFWYPN